MISLTQSLSCNDAGRFLVPETVGNPPRFRLANWVRFDPVVDLVERRSLAWCQLKLTLPALDHELDVRSALVNFLG